MDEAFEKQKKHLKATIKSLQEQWVTQEQYDKLWEDKVGWKFFELLQVKVNEIRALFL